MNNTKTCTKCKHEFPATKEYYVKDNTGKFGLSSRCKGCLKELRGLKKDDKRKYDKQYREVNREEIKIKKSEYYFNNRDYVLNKCKEYTINNFKNKKIYWHEYYQTNKQHRNKTCLAWKSKNRERARLIDHRYRAKKRELDNHYTTEEWEECKKHFGNKCAYCGQKKPLEQEHFIPVTKGGEYTRNNIVPACRNCNAQKSNILFDEWYSTYGFYSKQREARILGYLNYNKDKIQQIAFF